MSRPMPLWRNRHRRFPVLRKDISTDYLVIGGGMTGISAAYHLPPKRTVVIERGMVADQTGRGTGILTSGLDLDFGESVRKVGLRRTKLIMRHQLEAFHGILRAMRRHRIRCEFETTGSLLVALEDKDLIPLRREYRERLAHGLKGRLYDAKRSRGLVRAAIRGAMYSPHDALFNQEKFIQGLAHAAAAKGTRIFEKTEALALRRAGKVYEIRTPRGVIRAKAVLLAAGGGDLKLIRPSARIRKYTCFVLATKPLSRREFAALGWRRGHTLWPLGSAYDFVRLTGDRRLLVGGEDSRIHLGPLRRLAHFLKLKGFLKRLFPQLGRVAVDYEWTGDIYYGKNELPQIGSKGKIHYGFAYAGNGLLTGFHTGRTLAVRARRSIATRS